MSLMDCFSEDYSDSVESVYTSHHLKVKQVICKTFELYAQDHCGVFSWNIVEPRHLDSDTYAKNQATKRFLKALKLHYMSNLCDTVKYKDGRGVDYIMDAPIFDDVVRDGKIEYQFDLLSEMFDSWDCFSLEDQKKFKISIADHNDAFAKFVGFCIVMNKRVPTRTLVEDGSNPGIGEAGFEFVNVKLRVIDNDPVFERILSYFPDYKFSKKLFHDKDPSTEAKNTILKENGYSGNGNDILVINKNICGNKHIDYFFIGEVDPTKNYGFEWVYPLPYSKSYKYIVAKLSPNGEEISGAALISRLYIFRLSLWHSNYNQIMVRKCVIPLNLNAPEAMNAAIKFCQFERRLKAIDLLGISVNPDAISLLATHGYFSLSNPFTNFFIDKGVSKIKTLQYFLSRHGGDNKVTFGAERELSVSDEYRDIALAIAAEYKVTPPVIPNMPKSARMSAREINAIVEAEKARHDIENHNEKISHDKKQKELKKERNSRNRNSRSIPKYEYTDPEPESDAEPRPPKPRYNQMNWNRRNVQVRRPTAKKY